MQTSSTLDLELRRVASVWLPRFATDLYIRRQTAFLGRINKKRPKVFDSEAMPLALVEKTNSQLVLTDVNLSAERAGLHPGLSLSDARIRCSNLHVAKADLPGEYKALESLAAWCIRYTPWTAADMGSNATGASGLWLDIQLCNDQFHLFV